MKNNRSRYAKKPISTTARTRRRFDRLAFFYDFLETPMERLRIRSWRAGLHKRIIGHRVLEVGVGTGKNLAYHPKGTLFLAVDFSRRMMKRAIKRTRVLGLDVSFIEMDAEYLAFPENSFDTVFATFVFCSVPNPVAGLRELKRVCRPNGRLLLLEHMKPGNPILGLLFDLLNPFVVRIMGANINRKTTENVRNAGWNIEVEEKLASDIVRWIEAKPS